jgi:soluble lytic murein transglycosylase-like protein
MVIASRDPSTANAEPAVTESRSFFSIGDTRELRDELESAKGQVSLLRGQLERAERILGYATKYRINAALATDVFDASVREGIDPELAFRLVRLESEFNERAISKVGAVGLTQLMPSTAALIEKGTTRDHLFNPKTNLRIGFRYLRGLLDMYKGNVRYAVLAYNRGEVAVWRDLKAGINPGDGFGYDEWVLKGYRGKGTID